MTENENAVRSRSLLSRVWLPLLLLLIVASAFGWYLAAGTPKRHPGVRWHRRLSFKAGEDRRMAFSPDGKHLAVANWDKKTTQLTIWNTEDGTLFCEWPIADWQLQAIAFAPDGRSLACGLYQRVRDEDRWESSLRLFDLRDAPPGMSQRQEFRFGYELIGGLSFSPDGQTLAILGTHSMRLWDVPKWRQLVALEREHSGSSTVAFAPDGKRIAAVIDKDIKLFKVGAHEWLATLPHANEVQSISFSPDGGELAASVSDGTVVLWELQNFKPKATLKTGYDNSGLVAFTPKGDRLITFGTMGTMDIRGVPYPDPKATDGTLLLWDLHEGFQKQELMKTAAKAPTIIYCPTNSLVATAENDNDHSVDLWDLAKAID